MKRMKEDIIRPVAVLTLICLVVSVLLALTNSLTRPVIEAAAAEKAAEALRVVLPQADGFEALDGTALGLPQSVTAAYRADNGAGYVFIVLSREGYGGDMEIICGIGADGRITACRTLSHAETEGIGSKTAEEAYNSQYTGKDANLEGVAAISHATVSSTAYENAVRDAFLAYELVKEAVK